MAAIYLSPPSFRFSKMLRPPPPPPLGRRLLPLQPWSSPDAGVRCPSVARTARPRRKCWRILAGPRNRSPAAVTSSTWDELVIKSEMPVFVLFWASWCGPCKMVDRVIDEIAVEYTHKVNFFRLDADEELKVVADYGIERVPTVVLFKNGVKTEFIVGTMPKEIYEAAIEKMIS